MRQSQWQQQTFSRKLICLNQSFANIVGLWFLPSQRVVIHHLFTLCFGDSVLRSNTSSLAMIMHHIFVNAQSHFIISNLVPIIHPPLENKFATIIFTNLEYTIVIK